MDIYVGNYYNVAIVFHKKKAFDGKQKVQWMDKWLIENSRFAKKIRAMGSFMTIY